MDCDRSRALVSVYVDGELGEELAASLRQHLMGCAACRAQVAEAKAVSAWFVPGAELAVPRGFAQRVTQRAFAGALAGSNPVRSSVAARDGARNEVQEAALGATRSAELPWAQAARDARRPPAAGHAERGEHAARDGRPEHSDGIARFAMSFVALAAAVLVGLTLLLARDGGAEVGPLRAVPSLEGVLQRLEELNRSEGVAPVSDSSAQPEAGAADPSIENPEPRSPR